LKLAFSRARRYTSVEIEKHSQFHAAANPMILCICQSVTDREVDAAIRDGAHSLADVSQACGAGGDCGSCRRSIRERIEFACSRNCSDCPRREPELASAAL
jgi:bacterioferritin-associated ferredoxin